MFSSELTASWYDPISGITRKKINAITIRPARPTMTDFRLSSEGRAPAMSGIRTHGSRSSTCGSR
jgi:hypothetical protein